MTMSQSDIYTLAKSVGLTDSRAKVAAAIAMAESNGDPNAHNAKPPDDSYGLWQINMLGAMGPERRKKYGISDNSALYSPEINARAMKIESQDGGNFSAWSTYTNGAFQKYANERVIEHWVKPDDGGSFWDKLNPGNMLDKLNPVNVAQDYLQFFNKIGAWVSNSENWVRVGYVVGGGVVVIVGISMVLQDTKLGGLSPVSRAEKLAGTLGKTKAKPYKVGPTAKPGTASYDPK